MEALQPSFATRPFKGGSARMLARATDRPIRKPVQHHICPNNAYFTRRGLWRPGKLPLGQHLVRAGAINIPGSNMLALPILVVYFI
jgi:hypothetical protein